MIYRITLLNNGQFEKEYFASDSAEERNIVELLTKVYIGVKHNGNRYFSQYSIQEMAYDDGEYHRLYDTFGYRITVRVNYNNPEDIGFEIDSAFPWHDRGKASLVCTSFSNRNCFADVFIVAHSAEEAIVKVREYIKLPYIMERILSPDTD